MSGSSTELNDNLHLIANDISLFNEQRRDPIIGSVIEWFLNKERPEWQNVSAACVELKSYWSSFDSLEIRNDILFHKFENDIENSITWQIVLPTSLRQNVLHQLHNVPTARHLGVKKTLR